MEQPRGPGSPFVQLVDEDDADGADLPAEFRALYGRWPLPSVRQRPYTFTNFVVSRDGRVSFNEPGKSSGGPISGYSRHDRWLMALLRARADAVLLGGSSFSAAPRHAWTPEAIFPDDRDAWTALRQAEERQAIPLHVIVTRTGTIFPEWPVIRDAAIPALVATTHSGITQARELVGDAPNVRTLALGDTVDFQHLLQLLHKSYGVRTVLSEAGPQIYGALIQSRAVDDEFLTLSPIVVGSSTQSPRPSLVESVAFRPDDPPRTRLLSVHRAGDLLFLHSRYV